VLIEAARGVSDRHGDRAPERLSTRIPARDVGNHLGVSRDADLRPGDPEPIGSERRGAVRNVVLDLERNIAAERCPLLRR
jgi:hypothetical protein